ncbi:YgaP family membrane protein [Blastochloris viridis]|uniref:DUF2892 domain-containing protein n=1 Tax=Blastochloris viridis TaxID=1079 RepID=A0A0H5BCX8_BLAVI|nr:DUF2892 domain-containing protein [Blastochloris viridis]ALK10025.1 hypothetical protein BVIR_2257 [Blastochloris viridis]BAS00056.1 hypothetical protein BV133_2462 [Blastochloris viridis]CUU42689.1 hypothetical protein BVIRIDIS_17030 [Blastochloris viridis]
MLTRSRLPATSDRVPLHTSVSANRAIARRIEWSVRYHAAHPERIGQRLAKLDREWDIERVLEANAAVLTVTGVALGVTRRTGWLVLPLMVGGFLFQHAVQGWCPPLPVLRRLGFRTVAEIDTERYALKAVRGDFGPIGPGVYDADTRAAHALQAARL